MLKMLQQLHLCLVRFFILQIIYAYFVYAEDISHSPLNEVKKSKKVMLVYTPVKHYHIEPNHYQNSKIKTKSDHHKSLESDEYFRFVQDQVSILENKLDHLKAHLSSSKWDEITLLNINIEADQILSDLNQLCLLNLPYITRNKIEKLQQSAENIKTTVFSLIRNEQTSIYIRNHEAIQTTQEHNDLNTLKTLVNSFEMNLQRLNTNNTNDKTLKDNDVEISNKMKEILTIAREIGEKNIPTFLTKKITLLKLWQNSVKSAVGLTHKDKTIKNKPKNVKHKDVLGPTNIKSNPKQIIQILHVHTEHSSDSNDKNVIKQHKEIQDPTLGVHVEDAEIGMHSTESLKHSLEIIKEWSTNLEIYLGIFDTQETSEKNQWELVQIINKMNNILNEVNKVEIQNIPYDLQDKIYQLHNRIKLIVNTFFSTVSETKDLNTNTMSENIISKSKRLNSDAVLKNYNEWITSLEKQIMNLKHQINSEMNEWNLTHILFQADHILQQLQEFYKTKNTTLPHEFKSKTEQLKLIINTFKTEVVSFINKQRTNHINQGPSKTNHDTKDFIINIKALKERVSSLEDSLKYLKNLVSNQDLIILIQINSKADQILQELKQFETLKSVPDNLKRKLTALQQRVKKIKNEIVKIQNNPQDMETIVPATSPKQNDNIIGDYIQSLELALDTLIYQYTHEEKPLVLLQLNEQAQQLLTKLDTLILDSTPDSLKHTVKEFEANVKIFIDNLKLKIQTIQNLQNHDKENDNHKRITKTHSNNKVTEEHINNLEIKLKQLISDLVHEKDREMLIHLYYQFDYIIYELQKIDLRNMTDKLNSKVKELIRSAKECQIKLSESRKEKNMEIQRYDTTKLEYESKENDKFQLMETHINNLYDSLNHLKGQLMFEQDLSTVTHINIEVNNILVFLHTLEKNELPEYLENKIKQLKLSAIYLQGLVTQKQSLTEHPKNQGEAVLMNTFLQEQVYSLELILNELKSENLFKHNHSTIIETNVKVNQILTEITKLSTQIKGTDSLSNKIQSLQKNAINFKDIIESNIRVEILSPMEHYINDLLFQLDSLKISSILVLTRAKITNLKRDLISLKETINSLTNYSYINQLQFQIREIVQRMDDLRSSSWPQLFGSVIQKFGNFLKDIDKKYF